MRRAGKGKSKELGGRGGHEDVSAQGGSSKGTAAAAVFASMVEGGLLYYIQVEGGRKGLGGIWKTSESRAAIRRKRLLSIGRWWRTRLRDVAESD